MPFPTLVLLGLKGTVKMTHGGPSFGEHRSLKQDSGQPWSL